MQGFSYRSLYIIMADFVSVAAFINKARRVHHLHEILCYKTS